MHGGTSCSNLLPASPTGMHRLPAAQAVAAKAVSRSAPDAPSGDPLLIGDRLLRTVQLVLAHGGQMGPPDAQTLRATFGAGAARADHAERALRCGLALLDLPPCREPPGLGVHSGAAAAEEGSASLSGGTAHETACLARAAPRTGRPAWRGRHRAGACA